MWQWLTFIAGVLAPIIGFFILQVYAFFRYPTGYNGEEYSGIAYFLGTMLSAAIAWYFGFNFVSYAWGIFTGFCIIGAFLLLYMMSRD